jgi:hypothetical protein
VLRRPNIKKSLAAPGRFALVRCGFHERMMLGGVAAGPALASGQSLQSNPALVLKRLSEVGTRSPIRPGR